MRHVEPLLFIKNPVIVKYLYTPVIEEESTSVFEMESSKEVERIIDSSVLQVKKEEEKLVEINPKIQERLDHLNHSFRKELYQPIEIVTKEKVVRGKIHEVTDGLVLIKEGNEEEFTSIAIHDVTDIRWKQESFII
ncbi:hypothetical protein [Sporosarcina obsidiansis]|uniref:hypothetical protein n=1 Tax=Sporosarcina obsidiansis TaxID=2660748 RepID=UPI00129AEE81|nr:hypothetical protein [Sporosarcina obsidiansis]